MATNRWSNKKSAPDHQLGTYPFDHSRGEGCSDQHDGGSGQHAQAGLQGEYPSTVCRYWVTRNIDPNMAKYTIVIPALAAVKRRFLKNARRAS